MKKALIIKLIGGNYTLLDLDTNQELIARARGKLRYMEIEPDSSFHKTVSTRTKKETILQQVSPKVGDYCHYDDSEDTVLIVDLLPRENELNRPDVANIDQVLLTFSSVQPDFSFNLLDKFLVLCYQNNLKPALLITKIDLIDQENLEKLQNMLKYYESIDLKIHYVNNLDLKEESLDKIFVNNQITVLAGQTGVGKSTFLNAISPSLDIKTGEISKALGRGRHTTRHTELYKLKGGFIADTPGFSKLDINLTHFDELKSFYPDFVKLSADCRFGNSCNHLKEPNCAVKRRVEDGSILQSRYENYQLFIEEIKQKKRIY